MTTSSRITSGFSALAWKTASRALPASPTGSRSSSASSRSRRPARTTAWSSTISTRILTSEAPPPRSSSRRLSGTRSPAGREKRESLAHPEDPDGVLASRSLVEAGAVVLDHGRHADARRERRRSRCELRVLDDVRERLLHDSIERSLHVTGQSRVSERGWKSTLIPACSATASVSRSSAATRP